jgi:uncharacterized protein (DUF1697 family)
MRTHVALLRGVNVGGRNRLAMADLRAVAEAEGLTDVATYIQSGNLVFCTPGTGGAAVADALERRIAADAGVRPAVVVLSREELEAVVAGNPYPDEADPKCLHVAFHRDELGDEGERALAAALERARAKGSRDEATVRGRLLYLRTPDGLGRSELAAQLTRAKSAAPAGTMRNWATVTKLLALLGD